HASANIRHLQSRAPRSATGHSPGTHRVSEAGRICGFSIRFRGFSGRERASTIDTMTGSASPPRQFGPLRTPLLPQRPGARRRELGLRPTALAADGPAGRRPRSRRNFHQEARHGQLKSAEQLPARRFPRATGCRWNRRPPTADQKTVLTAIILRFLQQSVSEEGDGLRLRTLLSFSNFELNLLALFERAVAVHLDCAPVNEHVLVFAFEGDESVALFSVEPLDGTLCHYFSIQCSAIEIPHLSRDQAT